MSRSNSEAELNERERLLFGQGAVEFWICDLEGHVTFFDPAGPLPRSRVCPDFLTLVVLN